MPRCSQMAQFTPIFSKNEPKQSRLRAIAALHTSFSHTQAHTHTLRNTLRKSLWSCSATATETPLMWCCHTRPYFGLCGCMLAEFKIHHRCRRRPTSPSCILCIQLYLYRVKFSIWIHGILYYTCVYMLTVFLCLLHFL